MTSVYTAVLKFSLFRSSKLVQIGRLKTETLFLVVLFLVSQLWYTVWVRSCHSVIWGFEDQGTGPGGKL